ncbi:ABC transporter ATP-binding protein [Leptolyngbya sp. FACHB-261]|uniref:ABC transporter ATP-binding protein n=1 Tax=Leptolyngbya sp. FACHB-261 TaxID=2692806 RepID=UPI001683A03B|nr:ABC transporter ATP-binding protein [Leptolyngbya sp. FACHB-261]MBD2101326.1 ABC transporter ATP-binding protein [Leptolyngbya sp. FACHB-261]
MSEPILQVRNLRVQFQTDSKLVEAVSDVSFSLNRGETLGIVGESGSGKSVTSLTLMRLVPCPPGRIASGEVLFHPPDERTSRSVNLLKLPESQMRDYRGNRLGMIFQEPMSSLNPVFTCGFQVTEAIRLHQNVSATEARRLAVELFDEVKLPTPEAILDRYPHELSGGQLQRVMIAMAISCNPDILIADEPTTALDVTVQATILDLLRELRDRRGMSILFITHDLGVIAEIADSVAVMYQGKVVEYGSVLDIFSKPQHPYTRGLLTCRPRLDKRLRYLPTVSDFMQESVDATGAVLLSERALDDARSERLNTEVSTAELRERNNQLQSQEPLLKVEDLKVFFPVRGVFGQTQRYVMAVNDVSFEVYRGETLGLVGESGCGKTTLGRALLRLVKPTGGRVLFEGTDVLSLGKSALRQLRRDMQIIFQDPFGSLDPRMSVGDAIMEPLRLHKNDEGVKMGGRACRERAGYLLERVGLSPESMNRFPHEFSGGQRQRICIARALALNPKFIICDESVSALDVSVQAQVLNLLKELQEEFGLTYIFISHDLSVVKFMSDRIIVMNKGKIEEIGPAEEIYQSPQQDYTRALINSIPLGNLEDIRSRQTKRGLLVE